jgi:short-subunit dehydrogenase
MPRNLRDSVVVINGASSGIGRAAALAFAERGASVVLAARRREPLEMLVQECEQRGGHATAVPLDITEERAAAELSRRAVEQFGCLDVWVNNAGAGIFARFEETPLDAFRRLMDLNFFGYVSGAQAALARFREFGGGVLINNASIDAVVAAPYMSAYAASKFAVRGLSQSLRQELRGSGIDVCTIMPATMDTPFFQHAANYTGRGIETINPVYAAERVAQAMVRCAEKPRRELPVSVAGKGIVFSAQLAPALAERLMGFLVKRDLFQDRSAPPTSGSLFEPMAEGTSVSGGWRQSGELPLGGLAALAAAGSGLVALVWLRSQSISR